MQCMMGRLTTVSVSAVSEKAGTHELSSMSSSKPANMPPEYIHHAASRVVVVNNAPSAYHRRPGHER